MVDGIDATPVPRTVRDFAGRVRKFFDEEPLVEQVAPLRWRVALAGSRVQASADFRSSLGKTKHVGSTLIVDGEHREPMSDWIGLRILWDKFERPAAERPVTLEPVPPLPEGGDMPAEVRQLHDVLASALSEAGALVVPVAGRDENRWIIGVDSPDDDGDGVRFIFTRTRSGGHWALAGKRPIQLIAGGADLSAEIGRDVSKAIAALTGKNPAGSAAPPVGPIDRSAQKARDIGIEMRKGNTIRV